MVEIKEDVLIQSLKENQEFINYEQIVAFNKALDNLVLLKNPDHLEVLFHLLKDESDYPEVIDGVIHAIEYYGIDFYLPYLLTHLDELYKQAPEQIMIIFVRILNSEETLTCLRKNMKASYVTLETILFVIGRESEQHKALCQELIQVLKRLR